METPQARAVGKYIRVSSSKALQVINMIKGKDVAEAGSILTFCEKGAAGPIGRLLKSAVANAEKNHDMSRDELIVLAAFADQGPTLKRFRPRAQGRASKIRKRMSHITIVVGERAQEE